MTDDTDDGRLALTRRTTLGAAGAALGSLALGGTAVAQQGGSGGSGGSGGGARRFRITVTNLTGGQPLTPPAVALHQPSVELFSVGEPANEAVTQVAENGNLDPLLSLVEETNAIRGAGVFTSDGSPTPLVPDGDPGDTGLPSFGTIEVSADASATHLSFISMLIATNDGFAGLDTVALPEAVNASHTHYAASYDSGTEENTESFEDIVPPAQFLVNPELELGRAPGGGSTTNNDAFDEDGVIEPHPGIEGTSDLEVDPYDWTDPVAIVHVERIA